VAFIITLMAKHSNAFACLSSFENGALSVEVLASLPRLFVYTSGIRGRIVRLPTVWNIPPGTLSYMDARPGRARGRSKKECLGVRRI